MNRGLLHALALVLPLAGLAALWGWTDVQSREGTDWDVPVSGYDPRDLLRGHYIEFRYDWPGLSPEGAPMNYPDALCLDGAAPRIDRVTEPGGGEPDCPNYARADDSGSYSAQGLGEGRLYVPQAQAGHLQEKLMDQKLQAVLRIRLRADGHITPLAMRFIPRPPDDGTSNAPAR